MRQFELREIKLLADVRDGAEEGNSRQSPGKLCLLVVKSCVAAWSTRWRRVHMSARVRVLARLTREVQETASLRPDATSLRTGDAPECRLDTNVVPSRTREKTFARSYSDIRLLAFSLLFFFGFFFHRDQGFGRIFFTVCMPNYTFFNKSHAN